MDVWIQVSGSNDQSETGRLWEWLRRERSLAGQVRAVQSEPGAGQLGGAVDVLAVTLGSGGAGAVLARSLLAWLQSRRATVAVTVKTDTSVVTVSARDVRSADALRILMQVLPDDHE
jgi:Effector Associated Constant Component 1